MTSYADIVDTLERDDVLDEARAGEVRSELRERLGGPEDSRLIAAIAGVGAWFAAIFVLGCLLSLTASVVGEVGLLAYTVILGGAAVWLHRTDALGGVFVRQVALAASAAAQLIVPFSLMDAPLPVSLAAQLSTSGLLYVLFVGRANRLVSAAIGLGVSSVLLVDMSIVGHLLGFGVWLMVAGAVFTLESELDTRTRQMLRPAAFVCVVLALLMSISPLIADVGVEGSLGGWHHWIMRGITALVAIGFVVLEYADEETDDRAALLAGVSVVVLLGLATSTGVFVSLLVAGLGFWKLERILVVLGGLGLFGHLGVYYYQLDITLLEKSGLLVLSGLLLLAVRWWHVRRRDDERVEEVT